MSKAKPTKLEPAEVEVYERVMSENEFRIRQYDNNEATSRATGPKVLRLVQFPFDQEYCVVDLDCTQCFQTGWLAPGPRLIKAFGYNPAGEQRDTRVKLESFLLWVLKTYDVAERHLDDKGRQAITKGKLTWDYLVTFSSLNVPEILGTYGKGTARGKLIKWLKATKGSVPLHDLRGDSKKVAALIGEHLGIPKEERQLSPLWLEVAVVRPNAEDPEEVHACETQCVEDPGLVTRVGFKQNDMGYFVLMPKMAAFTRTAAGLFDEIEQRSYYPYYPWTESERLMMMDALDLLLGKMAKHNWAEYVLPDDENPVSLSKVKAFRAEIENITNERGPQEPKVVDSDID